MSQHIVEYVNRDVQGAAFEMLLSDISCKFNSLSIDMIDGGIESAQRRICECLGYDTSTLWQWSTDEPSSLTLTHMHSPPGGPVRPARLDAEQAFPWTFRQIFKGRTFTIATEELPEEALHDRETRSRYGIRSSVILPLQTGGLSGLGVLSFGRLYNMAGGSEDNIKRLELVAQVFCHALARKRYDRLLRQCEMRLKLAMESAGVSRHLRLDDVQGEQEFESIAGAGEVVGKSEALKKVLAAGRQVAATDATVLILGETGTGKGLLAKAIHKMSPRRDRPFITVNCAVLPVGLIESELFGREKGAFTGAHARQAGRFELADGGTIFLDEIGEMPLELQAKLLRVLQDGEFERIGGNRTVKAGARVIAATARDLAEEVALGRFRQDLFYRLNVFPITMPPLRQRPEDIVPLVGFFIDKYNRRMNKQVARVDRNTLDRLVHYRWPGNVRELEHLVERCIIVSRGEAFTLVDELGTAAPSGIAQRTEEGSDLASVERNHILRVLRMTQWKIEGIGGAAAILDLHPSTLRFRIKKLGILRPV